MDWETKLISTYFLISDYAWIFETYNERFSNNNTPKFTDIEVATIYIFCTTNDFRLRTKKSIHEYAHRHLISSFPNLPKYEAFNYRVNKLSECFRHLADAINKDKIAQHQDFKPAIREYTGDSMPIVMAKGKSRAVRAKVAKDIANLGYCATKKMYYHGLKLHQLNVVASSSSLPHPALSTLSRASVHDYEIFKNELLPQVPKSICYLDSAYYDENNKAYIKQKYNVTICAVAKRKRGQKALFYDQKLTVNE